MAACTFMRIAFPVQMTCNLNMTISKGLSNTQPNGWCIYLNAVSNSRQTGMHMPHKNMHVSWPISALPFESKPARWPPQVSFPSISPSAEGSHLSLSKTVACNPCKGMYKSVSRP